jgi:2-methylcitrate dehydratase PrpD
MTGTLAAFARHAADRPRDWPDAARENAQRCVVDTLACILGGRHEPASRAAAGSVNAWRGGAGGALDLVAGGMLPSPWAALVNGTAAHVLDYDDVLESALAHASAVLVPAVLALGEERGASGAQVLDALLIGFDVMSALAASVMVVHYTRGWHSTLTLGAPAAAAACGRLIGLDAQRMAAAISAATSFSAGSKRQFGTAMKPIHAGLAAQAGILAASLAEAGATAAPDILDDGAWSFRELYAGAEAPGAAAALESLAGPPAAVVWGNWLKAYPCCASAHRPIDALMALRERHGFAPADIAAIEADVSIVVQRNLMYDRPTTPSEARFSLNHCLALAAEGSVTLTGFLPEAIAAREAFWPRVAMKLDPALTGGPGDEVCTLRVTLRDNRLLEETVAVPRGHPQRPLTRDDLAAKMHDCAEAGSVPRRAADDVLGALDALDTAGDLARLRHALQHAIKEHAA